MAIYDPKIAIFVTDMIRMVLKSFKYILKLYEATPNTVMIFIYFDPLPKGLKVAIYNPKIALFITNMISMLLESFKYIQK